MPLHDRPRITHLDTVRGAAVMGILIINSLSFFFPFETLFDPSLPAGQSPLDWMAAVFGEIFVDQKFMGLFSLLFGASFLLFLERIQDRTASPLGLVAWRQLLLFCIGILHSLAWDGDILATYALCTPILLVMRRASTAALFVTGTLMYLMSPMMALLVAPEISVTAFHALDQPHPDWRQIEMLVLYLIVDGQVRALGMMLIGMGLYRSGWLRRPHQDKDLKKAFLLIPTGAALSGLGLYWMLQQGDQGSARLLGNIPNTLGTPFVTLGFLILLMAWDRSDNSHWVRRLRALGRMALSNYLAQTLLCLTLAALIPESAFSRSGLWLLMILIWGMQLLASSAWLQRYRFGPVEWLWRSATYRRWEPMKRESVRS